MSSFMCDICDAEIIDTNTGYITGCEHYSIEDLTELSGKQMSDGATRLAADEMAVKLIKQYRSGQKCLNLE